MDKLNTYRKYIQDIIQRHARHNYPEPDSEIEVHAVIDAVNDHYQLVQVGWKDVKYFFGAIVHVDIKNGKFWIQYDGTEDGVATELVEMGVPKEDIILAFYAPYKRQYTGFAVN